MGKSKKAHRRKKEKVAASPRNMVTIERVLGSANFGERHDTDLVHLNPTVRPAQLPARDPDFAGRSEELETLRRELIQGGAVAVFGKPGVGKTAFTVELAHALTLSFPEAQLYVNLNGASGDSVDVERVLESFLRALGFSGGEIAQSFDEKISQYRSALNGRRCIVVVDNAANENQVRQLLPGSSACVTIVTSRQSLGGLAGVRRHRMDTLNLTDSNSLLSAVIGEERVQAEPSAARELADRCGGLPLALRITANRLRDRPNWSLSYYAEKLSSERRRLELLRFGDAEVRASISLSYVGLEPAERELFRRLGIIPASSFGEQVISHLTEMDEVDASLLLERLTERNLLEVAPQPGRYQMHDLIRVFALERLEEEEGAEAVALLFKHMVLWYAFMAETADGAIFDGEEKSESIFSSAEEATDWLESEHLTMVEVTRLAYAREMHEEVLRIGSALSLFFERRLHGNSWRKVSDYALESARVLGKKETLISALIGYVRMSEKFPSNEDSTVNLLDEAYNLAKGIGSRRYEAKVLYRLGRVARGKEKLAEAERILLRSAEMAKQAKSHHTEGNAHLALADIYITLGRHDEAKSSCEKARLIFLMQGDRHCQGNSWRSLGELHIDKGDHGRAVECFSVATRLYESVHDVHCSGMTRMAAAESLIFSEDFVRARIHSERAYEQFTGIGDLHCQCKALVALAFLDRNAGNYPAAIDRLERAGEILRANGSRRALARHLQLLGQTVQKHAGDEEAARYFAEAVATAKGVADADVGESLDLVERKRVNQ
ncbi:tetratricopeptide repeat protein [Streptomyces sp. SID4944]|nr:tetratricopeptide repeat protein [Streptomyces sp. SID4944]